MLNPINALLNLQLLQEVLKDTPSQNFNATLPLLLKVLEKKGDHKYLLQLGSQLIETKSQKALVLGKTYWALMHKSSVGATMLSNLIPQPKIMEQLKDVPLKFELRDLPKLLSQDQFQDYKEVLIQHCAHAPTRQDFLLFGNLLLSLHHQVASFVIQDGQQKEALIQLKPKKKQEKLEFYAIYPHLGPLQGVVYKEGEGVCLLLSVSYVSVLQLLEQYKAELKGFEKITLTLAQAPLEPLFNFEESLLDTRG
ncbi:hypothetical protein [Helicobacter felis]|uniref:hypothetical protein n=1 Tax=Helicobacter felis TaxID=214 RepID=UPI000CF1BA59|nr:hypothetical protein [Helicobacter felis]